MSEPFIAEIRMFGGNFAPRGWALCNGQIMSIAQNTALFSILGTTYGGNGTNNFGLPNLQSNAPMGAGQGPGLTDRSLGEIGGSSSVTLTQSEMATHIHTVNAATAGAADSSPNGEVFGSAGRGRTGIFTNVAPTVQMAPVSVVGGSQPHNNRQPYLAVSFIIALQGIFPSRN
ncbi:MAG: tail fiber protein [Actinomycetota bacterium]